MLVSEAVPGDIIETLTLSGMPTGNVYKVCKPSEIIGKVTCYTQYTRLKVAVHGSNPCRKLDPNPNLLDLVF